MTDELIPLIKLNIKTKEIDFAARTMPKEVDDVLMICIVSGLLNEDEAGHIRIDYSLIMIRGRHLN